MLKVRFFMITLIAIFFSGCFKLGYQIELGSQEPVQTQQEPSSGYYYKSPVYYTK